MGEQSSGKATRKCTHNQCPSSETVNLTHLVEDTGPHGELVDGFSSGRVLHCQEQEDLLRVPAELVAEIRLQVHHKASLRSA